MLASELVAEFRVQADDNGVPPKWSDATVLRYLNEAEREACLRARLLRDKVTTAICRITLDDTKAEYSLSPLVLDVHSAWLTGAKHPLRRRSHEEIEWRAQRALTCAPSQPQDFAVYGEANGAATAGRTLVIDRLPDETTYPTLDMDVFRLPKAEFTLSPDTAPEIAKLHHIHMIPWALHLAFNSRDSDRGDMDRSAAEEAIFTGMFGERPDANVQRKRLRHRPACVKSNW